MDLNYAAEKIKAEEITVDQLLQENPHLIKYRRTLKCLEDDLYAEMQRDFMTEGIWYYGSTEVGKLRADNYPGTKYYQNGRYWDNYRQQEVVVINKFYGQITFSDLMSIVDKWPYSVSRRWRSPIPFMSRMVIIVSKYHPEHIYKDDIDSMQMLYRRFQVINVTN